VLQNWRADLVATLGRTGTLIEWIQYTPYGMAVTNPLGNADFKGDGGVDGGDTEAFFLAWEGGLPSADINNDGGVDGADVAAFEDIWESGETPQAGLCMRTAVRVGYAGYQWDGSVNHDRTVSGAMVGLHHVRHRVYEPELGRWTRRDPIGYADGMSLFAYVRNAPILLRDPSGLSPRDCIKCLGTILTYLAACPTAIAACGTGAIPGTQLISWPACLLAAAGCLGSALQGVQSCTVCITYLFPGGMPPTIPAQIKPNPAVPRSTPISPDEPCWGEPLSGDKVIVVEPRETNWPDPCHCAKNYNENLVQCRRCPEGSADRTGCILMVRERFDRCEKICPELLRESAPVLVPH
jgi:RHS repeat-associated protein